jgi:hypothetical protein
VSTDMDLELVRELYPESEESSQARDRARAALLAQIATATGARARRRRIGRRLPLLPSIGLAGALAAAVAAVVIAAGLRGGAAQPASAAAAVLERAALAAQTSGGPRELHAGEYWYVHSREIVNGAVFADTNHYRGGLVIVDAVTVYDRQVWMGVDKHSLVKQRFVAVRFLSPAARREWVRGGRPPASRGPLDHRLPADPFDPPYKQLLALPTNVGALYTVIERRAGKGTSSWQRGAVWQRHEMFTVIGDLLREQPVPAGVRAALYRVAARIPGIEVAGLTHDAIGRPALAITLNDIFDGLRDELLFDPRTANLLAETSVVVKPPPAYHVKPGTVFGGITYLASGIVQRIGQLPHS